MGEPLGVCGAEEADVLSGRRGDGARREADSKSRPSSDLERANGRLLDSSLVTGHRIHDRRVSLPALRGEDAWICAT